MVKKDKTKEKSEVVLPKFKPQFGQKNSQFSREQDIEPTSARSNSASTTAFKTQHKG